MAAVAKKNATFKCKMQGNEIMHSMRSMEMWNTVQQIFDIMYCCNQVAPDIARTLHTSEQGPCLPRQPNDNEHFKCKSYGNFTASKKNTDKKSAFLRLVIGHIL